MAHGTPDLRWPSISAARIQMVDGVSATACQKIQAPVVLVTGATGMLGTAIVRRPAADGYGQAATLCRGSIGFASGMVDGRGRAGLSANEWGYDRPVTRCSMRAGNRVVGLRSMTRHGGVGLHLMDRRNAGSGTAPTIGRVVCGNDSN